MNSELMKEELQRISSNHNVSIHQVKELIYLVFKFLREKINSADRKTLKFPVIRLLGIGVFFVSQTKQKKLKKKMNHD